MWTELVEYEQVIEVVVSHKGKDDEVYLFSKENYEELKKEIRAESHIEVAPYRLVNKFNVSTRVKTLWGIDSEIIKHPIEVQQELRKIILIRESKNLKTNWFSHLREIYLKYKK